MSWKATRLELWGCCGEHSDHSISLIANHKIYYIKSVISNRSTTWAIEWIEMLSIDWFSIIPKVPKSILFYNKMKFFLVVRGQFDIRRKWIAVIFLEPRRLNVSTHCRISQNCFSVWVTTEERNGLGWIQNMEILRLGNLASNISKKIHSLLENSQLRFSVKDLLTVSTKSSDRILFLGSQVVPRWLSFQTKMSG